MLALVLPPMPVFLPSMRVCCRLPSLALALALALTLTLMLMPMLAPTLAVVCCWWVSVEIYEIYENISEYFFHNQNKISS